MSYMHLSSTTPDDLSILLSQISSASGEVGDQTLEDLLRDCEDSFPSSSWCKESEQKNHNENPAGCRISSSNIFKSALDSLSEISSKVQKKLPDEDSGREDQPRYKPQKIISAQGGLREGGMTYRANRAALIRQEVAKSQMTNRLMQPKVTSSELGFTEPENVNKSSRLMSSRSAPSGHPFRQKTIVAATKLYGKLRTMDKHPPKVFSTMPEKNDLQFKSAGFSKIKTKDREPPQQRPVRRAPCRVPIQSKESQINDPSKFGSLRRVSHLGVSGTETFRINNEDGRAFSRLQEFKNLRSPTEKKCQEEIAELAVKCDNLSIAVSKELQEKKNLLLDADEETLLRTRDVMCGPSTVPVVSNKNPVIAPEQSQNFALDDLVLIEDIPRCEDLGSLPKNIPKLSLSSSEATKRLNNNVMVGQGMKKKSYKPNSASSTASNSEQRRLMTLIRSLQSELDSTRKENQRMKGQLANYNKWGSKQRSRGGMKRTVGTQTYSFNNDTLIRELNCTKEENVLLREKIKMLEDEITAQQERRQLDLRILQNKHEEEVELLLEEKLNLTKKMDMWPTWRSW